MGKLGIWDLAVFGAYMLFSIGVGVRFARGQKDLQTYLLADRQMHWALVAISVIAARDPTFRGSSSQTFSYV